MSFTLRLRQFTRSIVCSNRDLPSNFVKRLQDFVFFFFISNHSKGKPMKVLVPVKRVVDYNVKVRVKSDGSGVDIAKRKMSMNPFDEIAVEEATRLKEAGAVTEIVGTLRRGAMPKPLRTAMAIGADRGVLVETDEELQPLAVAKLPKALADKSNHN